jgi:hypothetical protein
MFDSNDSSNSWLSSGPRIARIDDVNRDSHRSNWAAPCSDGNPEFQVQRSVRLRMARSGDRPLQPARSGDRPQQRDRPQQGSTSGFVVRVLPDPAHWDLNDAAQSTHRQADSVRTGSSKQSTTPQHLEASPQSAQGYDVYAWCSLESPRTSI